MGVVELISAISLQAIGETAAVDVRRNAVEHEIADRVRNEMQRAIAGKCRELEVQPVDRSCTATTPKVFCSAWFSLRFAESKLLTPNAVNCGVCPGLFGI